MKTSLQGIDTDNWWNNIVWSSLRRDLLNIQQQIYLSSKNCENRKTKSLVKSLIMSDLAKLLAIYEITQKNKGRNTRGIDAKLYTTPLARMDLFQESFDYRTYKFHPVIIRRIPKRHQINRNHKNLRPIAIMTIKDRIMTKIISYALSAEWEAKLDSMVIGYRYGYSIQDAIFNLCKEIYKGKFIILKTDIQNFFENVSHKAILSQITFPQSFIKKLLKIKIRVQGKEHKNKNGLIQGNPLSPVLANIALYGMKNKIIPVINHSPFLNSKTKFYYLRYADDILILAANRRILENQILPNLIEFLKTKNLELNHDKTQIRKLEQGFEYLGYYIKQIGNKLEAKPLKEGYGYSILISKN